jgi:hypothetical protein
LSADPDPVQGPGEQPTGPGGESGEPTEQELRAAYEAELGRITATDMMAQAVVSLLNIGARRLGASGEGQAAGAGDAGSQPDLEQVRDAIDGARALLGILERRIPQELGPLRDALSRLQMAYAREIQAGAPQGQPAQADAGAAVPTAPAGTSDAPAGGEQPGGPGPAEASGRLWVPGR